MTEVLITRNYNPEDARSLADIYFHTIHNINTQDYSKAQVEARAPTSSLELDSWKKKWELLPPIVAVLGPKIVGFTELEFNGHIDCFFVHHEFQGCGAGSALMKAIDDVGRSTDLIRVYAEVSITAKTFFEKKGFKVSKEQQVLISGCEFSNFIMEKYFKEKTIVIKKLEGGDVSVIVESFKKSGWVQKPVSIFEKYLVEQNNKERVVWLAYINNFFAGYVTLKWESRYDYFKNNKIPEIMDLNVLAKYRKFGIGNKLLSKCEDEVELKSKQVGIGVGLYDDYGAAQKIYFKRGYMPDGKGATYCYKPVVPGDKYCVDDDLVIWFVKKISIGE